MLAMAAHAQAIGLPTCTAAAATPCAMSTVFLHGYHAGQDMGHARAALASCKTEDHRCTSPGQYGTSSPMNLELLCSAALASETGQTLQPASSSGERNNVGEAGCRGKHGGSPSPIRHTQTKKRRASQSPVPVNTSQDAHAAVAQVAQMETSKLEQELQAAQEQSRRLREQLKARDATIQQMQATVFQRAIQGARFYLGLPGLHQFREASDEVWLRGIPPLCSLTPAEQEAAQQIKEPLRKAEVARITQQLTRLQGMETALPAAAAPAPAGASPKAPAPAAAPAQSGASSGSPHAADAAAAAQAVQEAVAAAVAASQPTVSTDLTQHQELHADSAQQLPASQLAAWLAQTQPDMQTAWGGAPWMGQAAAAAGAMLGGTLQGGGARHGSAGNLAAAGQQQWDVAAQGAGAGSEGFSLRSPQHVGVYRSRRSEQGWRAQFSFANKVINLGTYDTAEDAARVWNETALLLRGEGAVLNPVEPVVPAGFVQGELRLPSHKAAAAVKAAAEAAGMPESVIQGIKVVPHASIQYA